MLEIAHEYSRDLLDFTQKKYGKLQKKGFQATDLLRKGHRVHMSSSTYGKKNFPQTIGFPGIKDTEFYIDCLLLR
jgi:hypothetical protein